MAKLLSFLYATAPSTFKTIRFSSCIHSQVSPALVNLNFPNEVNLPGVSVVPLIYITFTE